MSGETRSRGRTEPDGPAHVPTGEILRRLADTKPPLPAWFNPDDTERILREKYEPILPADLYARLREKCGLGTVVDGEIVPERKAITASGDRVAMSSTTQQEATQ